jgi:hypothetical protein
MAQYGTVTIGFGGTYTGSDPQLNSQRSLASEAFTNAILRLPVAD